MLPIFEKIFYKTSAVYVCFEDSGQLAFFIFVGPSYIGCRQFCFARLSAYPKQLCFYSVGIVAMVFLTGTFHYILAFRTLSPPLSPNPLNSSKAVDGRTPTPRKLNAQPRESANAKKKLELMFDQSRKAEPG